MNKLFYGDNLDVLRKYVRDETVDLCYIDPPFNSKRNYNQIYNNIGGEDRAQAQAFVDTWTWDAHANSCYEQILDNENGVQTQQSILLIGGLEKVLGKGSLFAYLVSMTARIAEIHRALKATGSFYLHVDPTASHYLKLVCDAIFCGARGGEFQNEITWNYKSRHFSKKHFGRKHDVIFLYTKTDKYTFNWQSVLRPLSEVTIKKFKNKDEKGLYRLVGRGIKGSPIQSAKDVAPEWEVTHPHLVKRDYLKEGVPIEDYWDAGIYVENDDNWEIEIINQAASERLGYPTQKPEALLERIINASSNEGDTILDAYCGCGTTVAVAQRLKRRWIGIDITYQSIALVIKRLEDTFGKDVTQTIELNGVPRDIESVRLLVNKRDDRVRKEFEKWAVLTYSDNRAVINEKRGADRGIDGVAFVADRDRETGDIKHLPLMLSVKSGAVGAAMMRDLRGVVEREAAAGGVLLTLEEPTAPMLKEAKQAGQFKGEFATFDRLQIVTVRQILEGERLRLPLVAEVAKRARAKSGGTQLGIFAEG